MKINVKNLWIRCGLVGLGLWVAGILIAPLNTFVASHPTLTTILIPVHWLIFGFVAIKLTEIIRG